MKPGIDLSKFKKVSVAKDHSVLKHDDGHELKIYHKALNPKLKEQLTSLPTHEQKKDVQHFDEGGVTQSEEDASAPVSDVDQYINANQADAPPDNMSGWEHAKSQIGNAASSVASGVSGAWDAIKPDIEYIPKNGAKEAQKGPAPASAPMDEGPANQAAAPAPSPQEPYLKSINEQIGADKELFQSQQGTAQLQGDLAKQQAEAWAAREQQAAEAQKQFNVGMQKIDNERAGLLQHLAENPMDADRYIKNMSTGGKIGTALGLILGGMGAGLTHGPNLAFNFLQSQIDRDVDSQKAELGKTQNLLSQNLAQTGNLMAATNLTKIQTGDMLSSKLAQMAAQTNNLDTKNRVLSAKSLLDGNIAKLHQEGAQMFIGLGGNGGSQISPLMRMKFLKASPEDQTAAAKEMTAVEEQGGLKKDLLESFDHVAEQFRNGLLSPNDTASAKGAFIGKAIKTLEGRYNSEAATKLAESIFPNTTDSPQTVINKRRRLEGEFSGSTPTPVLNKYGMGAPQSQPAQSKIKSFKPVK